MSARPLTARGVKTMLTRAYNSDTPAQFASRMRADYARFREIVKAAGLKPE